jgi:HSP20 family molecular chaperone IbpA
MNDLFDYFFGFDKSFNYESLGMRTYRHISKDNKEILAVNVAGFSKEDIKLEPKSIGNKDYLYIIGMPKDDVKEYVNPLNIRFEIDSNRIDNVDASVKDGMLYVTVTKKNNKPKISINF